MNDWGRLEHGIMYVTEAFMGMRDKKGMPTVLHSLAVMEMLSTESEKLLACAHDIPEDIGRSIESVARDLQLTEEETTALRALTHKKCEPYEDYIRRIIDDGGRLAIKVKCADILHNSSYKRLDGLPSETVDRLTKKYEKAATLLSKSMFDFESIQYNTQY